MDVLPHLLEGFRIAFIPANLLYAFVGVFVGTLIGVLPGIGPAGTISILIPITFRISPVSAIIMLAGIYYGAMYGGSTTSILVNIPGEAASVVTCLDGYQMARQGRAGPALGISAFGSFIAGTFSIIGLMVLAFPLAKAALRFGPPEYFGLMVLGLTIVTYLVRGSVLRALQMAVLGIFLSSVGMDVMIGTPRFTFGIIDLADGIGLVPLVMGVFGISEVLLNVEQNLSRQIFETKIKGLLPNLKDWKDSKWPIVRGTLIGFFLGVLPGGGAIISSFVSYAVEKRVSKHPEKFGKGAIEGVAGPESANNAAIGGAFIPFFSLGIPPNVVMALLLGALMIHGVQPGPLILKQHPDIFWGTVASMYVGNGMLLLLNLPLIGIWVKILKIPYPTLFPLILLFCLIGSYSINFTAFDILVMVFFGIVGYILRKLEYEFAPLVLGYVLGPMLERSLRQSLILSDGSFLIFISRPISAVCILASIILLLTPLVPYIRKRREVLTREVEE
jgi:putative tricarboxylic transport membrane protein